MNEKFFGIAPFVWLCFTSGAWVGCVSASADIYIPHSVADVKKDITGWVSKAENMLKEDYKSFGHYFSAAVIGGSAWFSFGMVLGTIVFLVFVYLLETTRIKASLLWFSFFFILWKRQRLLSYGCLAIALVSYTTKRSFM